MNGRLYNIGVVVALMAIFGVSLSAVIADDGFSLYVDEQGNMPRQKNSWVISGTGKAPSA
jgi:hypothetical protein